MVLKEPLVVVVAAVVVAAAAVVLEPVPQLAHLQVPSPVPMCTALMMALHD